jgi:iron(III) transport system ATP-binding protein
MAELVVQDLGLRLGGDEVLKGVSLRVAPGTVAALLGPSGSGKTTLLRAVAGLETPDRGAIRIGDVVLFDSALHVDIPAEQRGLGFVSQSYALWPHRTAFDNVAYGLKLRHVEESELNARVHNALQTVGLSDLAGRHPQQLSSGQQQRLALARALVYEPALILLDEPLSNLDTALREEARLWLRQLIVKHKLAIVLATDNQTEAMTIADRITLLNGGAVEQEGTAVDLYTDPATLFAAEFIGTNNRLDGTMMENSGKHAIIEVAGTRIQGIARTGAAPGARGTGVIRVARVMIGGGPGPNRIPMTLSVQNYLGERWELVFAKDALCVRAYAATPLKYEFYHVEFPPDSVWIF